MSSASISIRRNTGWCSASTKRAKFKRWTARSRGRWACGSAVVYGTLAGVSTALFGSPARAFTLLLGVAVLAIWLAGEMRRG